MSKEQGIKELAIIFLAVFAFHTTPLHAQTQEHEQTQGQEQNNPICLKSKDKDKKFEAAGRLCKSYIMGFLDGAVLTDTAIIENFTDEQSTFFQRAYRTRAAKARNPVPSTYLANFCLPGSTDQVVIVDAIMENLDPSALASTPLNQVIYDTIKSMYPCEQ